VDYSLTGMSAGRITEPPVPVLAAHAS